MTETHVMRFQSEELEAIRSIAHGSKDSPVLMLNQNRYSVMAQYPNGAEYRAYMAILQQTVERVGGQVLWRAHVDGQPIGCEHDGVHEILAIWYPSHAAFLTLSKAPGADEMLRLRKVCVDHAILHRCRGEQFPMQPQ
jgi:hypothetical protein